MGQLAEVPSNSPINGEVVPQGQVESVADRLAKLERALTNLQDQAQLEQRVTDKLLSQFQQNPPVGLLPAVPGLAAHSLLQGVMTAAATAAVDRKAPGGFWDWIGLLQELKLIFRMHFDPRYRLSRIAQIGVPVIFIMMVLNYLNFTQVWTLFIVAPILERVIFLALAVVLYKIWSREAQRYSEVLKYLAQLGVKG